MNYDDVKLYCAMYRRNVVRKKMAVIATAFMISAAVLAGCDKDDDDDNGDGTNNTDREFVLNASMSNYAEIQAGAVAATKARNRGIAMFGQMMVTDHTNAGARLKSIAVPLGLQPKDSLDAAHVRLADTLSRLTGRAFDSVYIHSQVRDHQTAIQLFDNERKSGRNTRLRNFADSLLPHLYMHLHHADSLRRVY